MSVMPGASAGRMLLVAAGFADIAIAATARRHHLMILSHNVRHFAVMDVDVINPFGGLPSG
jgi:predicted nucleic acid-binding protein